ncbi:hypothetical protein HJC23_001597 [Cyclotella cryptica]|uniref:Zinc finger C2H2 LYAR-type domain-containing protein n=1 Tax=Cyclotella cryptica TaxID=29204 RepID=A0ABD3P1F5_9STRA
MVFFVCDGCNETLKKNKVDAHAAKCRDCYAVSCVDCSVSFPGDDYRSHTSCITEAERYEKTVFRGVRKSDQSTASTRKALTKQEKWTQTIQRAADTAPPSLKSYMDQLTMLENIPTKEKQFRNFAANSLRLKKNDDRITTHIWEWLMKQKSDDQSNSDEKKHPSNQDAIATAPASTIPSDTKREKANAEPTQLVSDNDDTPSDTNVPSHASVKKILKKALKKASNHKLKFKVLRQTVKETLYQKADDTMKSQLEQIGRKKWKEIVQRVVEENPDRMKLDGKSVQWRECDSSRR